MTRYYCRQHASSDCPCVTAAQEVVNDYFDLASPRLNTKEPIDRVLAEMLAINKRKRADYATDEDPWSNFKAAAGQVNQAPGFAVEVLIGVKQARLKELLFSGREARNESVRDTLLDRAVYSVIALAMYDEELYGNESPQAA